jgi:hypothetical protein
LPRSHGDIGADRLVLEVTKGSAQPERQPDADRRVELELLFLCARMSVDDAATDRVRRLLARRDASRVRWETFLAEARLHRVVPLVYRTLSTMDAGLVPPDVLTHLQGEFRANSWGNLKLTAELVRVLEVLAADEIPVIPYKGPALAELLYGDVALRQFGDLDIILHSRDVERARESLWALGYRPARNIIGKDVTLFHERLSVTLEVHWSITAERHPVQITPQRLWKNLQHASLGGRPILAHTTEDLLWILCVHGGQHRWERLSWLCDVAEIVRGKPIDWTRALHNATEVRARRTVLLGLLLARDLLGARLPAEVERVIASDPVLKPLASHVEACLHSPRPDQERPGDLERYYIMLGEDVGDRLRIAFRQAVPYLAPSPRDRELLPLPRYLWWVLYIVRPIRLTRSYGLTPIKRLLKGFFQS